MHGTFLQFHHEEAGTFDCTAGPGVDHGPAVACRFYGKEARRIRGEAKSSGGYMDTDAISSYRTAKTGWKPIKHVLMSQASRDFSHPLESIRGERKEARGERTSQGSQGGKEEPSLGVGC